MIWTILEHRFVGKTIRKLPGQVIKKNELWKNLV